MVGKPLLPPQIGFCEAHGMKALREMLRTVPKIPVAHYRHKDRFFFLNPPPPSPYVLVFQCARGWILWVLPTQLIPSPW